MAGGLEKRLVAMADRCLGEMGLQLYHLEYRPSGSRSLLRLFIEKKGGEKEGAGGVDLEDCAAASRRFGDLLEAEDVLPSAYTLEVSSPGLDRALHGPDHYRRFAGSTVKVTTFEPIEGRRHFTGRIVSCDESVLHLAAEEGRSLEIPVAALAGGHLVGEV